MRATFSLLLLLAACKSESKVPCSDQATCDPFGAVCVDGVCRKPSEVPELDLSVASDLAMPPDLAPACTADAMCTDPRKPVCDVTARVCRGCTAGECAGLPVGGLCATTGPIAGSCVKCLDEAQCTATTNVCSPATGTCVACTASPQCGSGICDGGNCVFASAITYVDNKQTPCSGADGTRAKAYCTTADALTAMGTSKKYMYIAGSATPYVGMTLGISTPSDIYVAGPGGTATPTARLTTINMATSPVSSLTIASTGSGKTVVVDGLDIYGLPGGSALDYVVLAAGTVTVRIQDSLIHGSQGNALNRLGGDVTIVRTEITGVGAPAIYFQSGGGGFTLDRSYVHGNGGMLTIDAATALIENNLIVDNNGTGGDSAMQMNVTSTLKFRANTVANNHVPAGGLSFTCQGVVNTISDSIIVGNTATAGTQLQGCTLSHIVTGADGASGATQLLPAFVSATDYHLKPTDAANTACCIDKLGAGPAVDYDGTARPSGAAFDIGAFEAH